MKMNLTIIGLSMDDMVQLRTDINIATNGVFKEIHIVIPNERDPDDFEVKTYLGYEKYNGKFIILWFPKISMQLIKDFEAEQRRRKKDDWTILLGTYGGRTPITPMADRKIRQTEIQIYPSADIIKAIQDKLAEMVDRGAFDK